MTPLHKYRQKRGKRRETGTGGGKKTQREVPGNCKIIESLRFHINTQKHSTCVRGQSVSR